MGFIYRSTTLQAAIMRIRAKYGVTDEAILLHPPERVDKSQQITLSYLSKFRQDIATGFKVRVAVL